MVPSCERLSELLNQPISEEQRHAIVAWEKQRHSILLKESPSPIVEPARWRLSDERASITHHFEIGLDPTQGAHGYFTCGMYPDFRLGELFMVVNKMGSFISGFADAFSTVLSIALQHGVPLQTMTAKFKHSKFEPAGIVRGSPKEITFADSLLDYLCKWLDLRFPDGVLDKSQRVTYRLERPNGPTF